MKYTTVILAIGLWAVSVNASGGYEVVQVENGATLKGTVNFEGIVPPNERYTIDRDIEHCGKEQEAGVYMVSDSKVKNVVVWVDRVIKGKPITKSTVDLKIEKCMVQPRVSVGFVGGKYVMRNEDDILHTIQLKLGVAYQKRVSGRPVKDGATIYNLALPLKGRRVEKLIKRYHSYSSDTGFVKITSNLHTWIKGYIFVFEHPYAVVTDKKGAFAIDNLLPGEYLLKAWHEGFGSREMKIRVASGEIVERKITFTR